jgi:hypothetical protein
MVVKLHPKGDSKCIFGGFYQLQVKNIEVTITVTVERPQSTSNTIIGADFVDR